MKTSEETCMTIRELAKHLGISKTTVALALRDSSAVSVATREWVQSQAIALGYTPNPVASAFLRQIRSSGSRRYQANLAFLLFHQQKWPFLEELQVGALARSQELGYGLDVVQASQYTSKQLTQQLQARGVLGLIVAPMTDPLGQLALDWSRFACAAYGYSMDSPVLHRIVHHHISGIRVAHEACLRKGFRRIGLAMRAEFELRSNRQWSAGFLEIQRTLPPKQRIEPLLVSEARHTVEDLRRWILKEKPDVIIIQSADSLPRLTALLDTLPQKISCAVLDRKKTDTLPGIDQRFSCCGRLLVDVVASQILHNQRGIPDPPITSLVEGVWVE
jgi:LacI family transcriptional regulator